MLEYKKQGQVGVYELNHSMILCSFCTLKCTFTASSIIKIFIDGPTTSPIDHYNMSESSISKTINSHVIIAVQSGYMYDNLCILFV